MSNVFIHIGFPKTATTTLQGALMRHGACGYLGKGLREKGLPELSLRLAQAALYLDRFRFEAAADGLAAEIAALAATVPALVISDETFAFAEYMELGEHWPKQPVVDHWTVAHRLARLAPGAGVFFSTREQLDFVGSYYRQEVKRGTTEEPLADYAARQLDELPRRSMLHAIRYDEAYDAYADAFGPDRVHVSIYEAFREDFGAWLDAVAALTGLDADGLRESWGGGHANRDRPRRQRESVRQIRALLPKQVKGLLPKDVRRGVLDRLAKPPPPTDLPEATATAIRDYFAGPNRALADRTGLDLAAHGYAVAEAPAETASA